MSSAEPKDGDKVRVSFEVTYRRYTPNGVHSLTRVDGTPLYLRERDGENLTFEVLEPEYIPGEVYVAADGTKYLRLRGPSMTWRPLTVTFKSCDVGEQYPTRPLTKLVPENG